jgi:hypothetical protein
MEIFSKSKSKIVIATIIVILMNFIIPNISQAKLSTTIVNGGGTILAPILEFVMYMGDVVVNGLQTSIYPQSDAFLLARSPEEEDVSSRKYSRNYSWSEFRNNWCSNVCNRNWGSGCCRCGGYGSSINNNGSCWRNRGKWGNSYSRSRSWWNSVLLSQNGEEAILLRD